MSDTSLGPTEAAIDPVVTGGGAQPVEPAPSPAPPDDGQPRAAHELPQGMIPARARRRTKLERASMRVLATGGIIGIATVLGAVLVGKDVAGWIVGLVIGLTSVILAAVLWSSRQL
jgi:hypothetical protein